MRVVHIATAFPRSAEDPITPWLVELVRRQRLAGVDAQVLAPAYRGGPETEPTDVPVTRFRYAPAPLETLTHDETVPDRLRRAPVYGLLLPGYFLGGTWAAFRLGQSLDPDVIHAHWPMPHALLGAAMRAGSRRGALVCSYYSVELNWVRKRLPVLVPFLRWSAATADAVTAISTSTAAAVRGLVTRDVDVIPYGAVVSDDGGSPAREALEEAERDGGEPVIVLFVGRLVERKGVEVLVRAVAEGEFSRPVELRIVGTGEWSSRIAAEKDRVQGDRPEAAFRVRMLGRVSAEELEAQYEAADIFVLPAVVDAKGDTEGLGVVLLEALRFERPVIASAVGGITDIIEDGRTGLAVPPGDPVALGAAIQRLIADPDLARRLARQGREYARDRFGWNAIVAATTRAYQRARRAPGRG